MTNSLCLSDIDISKYDVGEKVGGLLAIRMKSAPQIPEYKFNGYAFLETVQMRSRREVSRN